MKKISPTYEAEAAPECVGYDINNISTEKIGSSSSKVIDLHLFLALLSSPSSSFTSSLARRYDIDVLRYSCNVWEIAEIERRVRVMQRVNLRGWRWWYGWALLHWCFNVKLWWSILKELLWGLDEKFKENCGNFWNCD